MPPSQTLMLTPLSFGGGSVRESLMQAVPARLLDRLPLPICRWDLSQPLPLTTDPDTLLVELQTQARLGYLNAAGGRLAGAAMAGSLIGTRLGALTIGSPRPESLLVRRFLAGGGNLAGSTIRIRTAMGDERIYRAHWEGVTDGGQLRAIWVLLEPEAEPAAVPARPRLPMAEAPSGPAGEFPEFVGSSAAMQAVLRKIAQVASTDSTVLIRGETGTGKELIARAIHERSGRRARPLVALNCGAIAPGLVESELFGHEKGAFTGAIARKIGRFEQADGGTLFLDEIGDLPPDLQVKLLRVLQEGEVVRVGATQPVRVNVRVVAATHRDLAAMVQRGQFRQDLYYRLNVFPVAVPALRDRAEDIPDLVRHFTTLYAERQGKRIETVPPALLERLSRFPWPGNIRELANVIERSVIVTTGAALQLAEWATGQTSPVAPASGAVAPQAMMEVERDHIRRTLEAAGWKVSGAGGAAERLGLKPTTLEARMKKLGVTRPA